MCYQPPGTDICVTFSLYLSGDASDGIRAIIGRRIRPLGLEKVFCRKNYFIKTSYPLLSFTKEFTPFSLQMEEAGWKTEYCLDTPGFPAVLYAALVRLGIMARPEYQGREYEVYGTGRCEVTIHIGASETYP